MDVYTTEYFTVAIYIVLAVICLFGNTWVVVTVLRQFFGCFPTGFNYLRTPKPAIYSASVYLLLLSIVDLISILPVPVLVVDILNNDFPFEDDLLGNFICKFIFFCEGANKSLSPLILTVLSVDRYVAVCRPGWICLRRPKIACCMVLLCFLLSLCFMAPVTSVATIGPMVDEKNRSHTKCYLDELPLSWRFDVFHILGCFILPLIIICSVYASILRRLYRHAHTSTVGKKTSIPLHRVVKCSAAVVGFYFICWTPYWTIRMGYIIDEYQGPPVVTKESDNVTVDGQNMPFLRMSWTKVLSIYFFHSLPYAQSAFNWLFYAFLNQNLRNSSSRPSGAGRSVGVTSVLIDHQNTISPNGSNLPSWKNHKNTDSIGVAVKKSYFTLRPQVRSRCSTPAEEPNGLLAHDSEKVVADNKSCSSAIDFLTQPSNIRPNELRIPGRNALSVLNENSSNNLKNGGLPLLHNEAAVNPKKVNAVSESFVFSNLTSGIYRHFTNDIHFSNGIHITEQGEEGLLLITSTDPRCKGVTVVAFIIYPAASNSFNVESLKGQAVCKQLRDTISKIKDNVGTRMFESCLRGRLPEMEALLMPEERIQLKRCILSAKRDCLPPITTHNMVDDAHDPVLNAFRRTQLINRQTDRVKVIFHPEFLSSVSPLMNLDYEDFVRGCHLGVFPSYYEPWGYTPAECTVMGVPSVTTNLSGFGCFAQEHIQDPQSYGIFVIDRRFKAANESIDELAKQLYDFTLLSRRQRIIMRNRTERLSDLLDWKTLGSFYREARRKALCKTHPDFLNVIQETLRKMPRPISAPSTPASSRPSSPHESDDETDTEEQEHYEAKAWEEKS